MNRPSTRMSLIFTCLFSFAAATQLTWSQSSGLADTKTADEREIYTTVIRSQMEQWIRNADEEEAEAKEEGQKAEAKRMNFRVFFVSIKGKDPTDSFIRSLHDIPRQIEKLSRARYGQLGAPFDRTTNRAGIIFSVEAIRWSNSDEAQLHGGYFCSGRCGAKILFRVQRKSGQWVVDSSEMEGVS